jgi:hypothetical protein
MCERHRYDPEGIDPNPDSFISLDKDATYVTPVIPISPWEDEMSWINAIENENWLTVEIIDIEGS